MNYVAYLSQLFYIKLLFVEFKSFSQLCTQFIYYTNSNLIQNNKQENYEELGLWWICFMVYSNCDRSLTNDNLKSLTE